MTKTWQLRALCVYLTLGLPFAASCAKEANTLEGDDSGGGPSGGSTAKAGATSKAGSTSAFGGTASQGGSGSGGKAGTAGSASAEAGDATTAGTAAGGKASGGTAGATGGKAGGTAGTAGNGGTGGSASVVPPDVLARAKAVVYYQTQHATAMDKTIQMRLFVKNQAPDPLPMDHVKIRYWLTAEVSTELHQYYHGPDYTQTMAAFVNDAANSNVLLTFSGGSIAMGSDMNASEVQLEIDNNSSPFNQADDFSWNPAYSVATPNDKITLYLDDKLIWGCEPSGACFDDGAGGAGGGGAGGAP